MEKKYFKSIEELTIDYQNDNSNQPAGDKQSLLEMQHEIKSLTSATRRDFLKAFGFTVASAAIVSSCQQPVRKAIPFLIQPENLVPGVANYYASTFFDGIDYCSVLVKVRDGRPIKIEGNTLSSVTLGGTNARTQASVLSLYDNARYKNPQAKGVDAAWDEVDQQIQSQLTSIKNKGGKIVIVSPTIISLATQAVINEFLAAYPGSYHVQYDVLSANSILKSNEKTFGKAFVPAYHFEKADIILSFNADFLGNWLSPLEYTKQYIKNRKLTEGQRTMSRHIHFEGGVSLTGSNADKRIQIRPSEEKIVIANLYAELKKLAGLSSADAPASAIDMKELAQELWSKKSKSLVVSGSDDTETQLLVNGINQLLENYGTTIDTAVQLKIRKGTDDQMTTFVGELNAGNIDGVILYDINPAYDYPQKDLFISGLKKAGLSISTSSLNDETAPLCNYICPDNHYLESWNDAEIKTGFYSLAQPAIRPIFTTRQAQESLLKWSGKAADFRLYLQNYWETTMFPKSTGYLSLTAFWNAKLHDGVFESGEKEALTSTFDNTPADAALANTKGTSNPDAIDLVLYANISVGTGKHANNPWLQELPDPISKITWDNYLAISPKLAEKLGLEDEQLVKINKLITLPVVIQPGQEKNTVSIALGYGRENAGIPSNGVGQNAYPLMNFVAGEKKYWLNDVSIEKVVGTYPIARTQTHHSMEGRAIVRETSLEEYLKDPSSGNEMHKEIQPHLTSLYEQRKFDGLHWAMSVDLNVCTGCNACVIACSAENNVPVVGKDQVLMRREMHWIRIDRYYSGDTDNPEFVRQPVMCQHCDNAPCENVCPVAATTHSNEGLNQMAYNRCIGTRYCNNNCPFKVRRFNFFDYTGADFIQGNKKDEVQMTTDLRRLVLNPDVTIRAKGVIEKCSLCVQRIQEKKLVAKTENRELFDGEIKPACAQSCPAEAIVFGNLNDVRSKVSVNFESERNYHLLEELHTLPSIGYLTKVKNTIA
ncbi:MAG: 4Fe-4S dicluster domain-containing protein [Bacteroidales bacterium]|nr:4Fe-4S dicluster domain-containing protein [Bacteroidales bacterium]